MTTESRMREALERIAAIGRNGLCPDGWTTPSMGSGLSPEWVGCAAYRQSKTDAQCWCPYCEAQAALSPPARRTSYAWVDEYGVGCRVRWSSSAWISEWAVGDPEQWVAFGHPAAAAAIATLAGLTPPEPRVPSVRSELAKHELIDKVSPSGEEIERACRSSEPEED